MLFNNRIDVEWIERYITFNSLIVSIDETHKRILGLLSDFKSNFYQLKWRVLNDFKRCKEIKEELNKKRVCVFEANGD